MKNKDAAASGTNIDQPAAHAVAPATASPLAESRQGFGRRLKQMAAERELGMRELARLAAMSHGLLCDILAGRKCAGAHIAVKLADALALEEAERESFLLAAAATRKHDKLMPLSRDVVPELVNHLPLVLTHSGMDPKSVVACVRQGGELTLTFEDGNTVTCTTQIVRASEGGDQTETG